MPNKTAISPPHVLVIWWTSAHYRLRSVGEFGHPSKFQLVSRLGSITAQHSISGHQPNCGIEQRAPPVFGRAAITLGIDPHSSYCWNCVVVCQLVKCVPCWWCFVLMLMTTMSMCSLDEADDRQVSVVHQVTVTLAVFQLSRAQRCSPGENARAEDWTCDLSHQNQGHKHLLLRIPDPWNQIRFSRTISMPQYQVRRSHKNLTLIRSSYAECWTVWDTIDL